MKEIIRNLNKVIVYFIIWDLSVIINYISPIRIFYRHSVWRIPDNNIKPRSISVTTEDITEYDFPVKELDVNLCSICQ